MPGREIMFRRRAMEIVTQLPEMPADARLVLAYARELLDAWVDQSASGGSKPNLISMPLDRSPSLPSSIHPVDKPGI